jgi:hypothetical protein
VTKAIQSLWKNNFPEKTANLHNLKRRYSGEVVEKEWVFLDSLPYSHDNRCYGHLGIASYSGRTRTKELV